MRRGSNCRRHGKIPNWRVRMHRVLRRSRACRLRPAGKSGDSFSSDFRLNVASNLLTVIIGLSPAQGALPSVKPSTMSWGFEREQMHRNGAVDVDRAPVLLATSWMMSQRQKLDGRSAAAAIVSTNRTATAAMIRLSATRGLPDGGPFLGGGAIWILSASLDCHSGKLHRPLAVMAVSRSPPCGVRQHRNSEPSARRLGARFHQQPGEQIQSRGHAGEVDPFVIGVEIAAHEPQAIERRRAHRHGQRRLRCAAIAG